MQGASTGQDLANKSAQLRLQEQLEKQKLLQSGLLGQQQIGGNLYGTTGQLQQNQNAQNLENYWNAQKINAGVASGNAQSANNLIGGLIQGGASVMAAAAAHGGIVGDLPGPDKDMLEPEAMRRVAVSPGEAVVNPDGKVMKVPGKANVPGDHPANDTVIADLRQDSIVVPRSKSGDKEKIIEFMKHVKESSKKKSDLQSILDSHNEIKQKLDELSYKMGKYRPK
jgi:hypothetical protein